MMVTNQSGEVKTKFISGQEVPPAVMLLKSRRWLYGERDKICTAANDEVVGMRRIG